MSDYDNKTVVLRKPQQNKPQNHKATLLAKIEEGKIMLPQVTYEFAQSLQQARCAKKLTQDQLAKQTQVPLSVIKDYENQSSGVIIKDEYLSKINRHLGTKLKKPSTKRLAPDEDLVSLNKEKEDK